MNRHFKQRAFLFLCQLTTVLVIATLAILLGFMIWEGKDRLSLDLLTQFPSRFARSAGLKAAIWGSFWLMLLTAFISIPIGVATAIYLEEYAPRKRWVEWVNINIGNLAGLPSIIYGLLGLAVFVRTLGFDRSLLSGALTLSLMSLPVIVIASKGAIAAVPNTIREGGFAVGARKYQVVAGLVLPNALPGILTGVILALSRAVGETAPLIMIGAVSFIAFTPTSPLDSFSALPIQIYNWTSRPQQEFHELAASGIIVLLAFMLSMNLTAIILRQRNMKKRL